MRTCIGCNKEKDNKAFIGSREFCRACWLDLTKEEKELELINAALMSKKNSQFKFWKDKQPRPSYKKRTTSLP